VAVLGSTGSGRRVFLRKLGRERGFVTVEPPSLDDPDASAHALIQAAAGVGPSRLTELFDSAPLGLRAARVAGWLVERDMGLAIRLPSNWRLGLAVVDDTPERRIRREHALEVLEGFASDPDLRIVLLAGSAVDLTPAWIGRGSRIELRPMRVNPELVPTAQFGIWAGFAGEVLRWCTSLAMSPVQYRLSVGLLALGVDSHRLRKALDGVPGLQPLENLLLEVLKRSSDLARAAYRLALARWPIDRASVGDVAGTSSETAELLSEWLAYGEESVSMHERVRGAVLSLAADRRCRAWIETDVEPAHEQLAVYHGKRDGQPRVTESRSTVDWLERVHHLANAGDASETEWRALELPFREFYWDRARALSLRGRYESAASLYEECLGRFGRDDSYAQHYLGFNLDRAGKDRSAAEASLRTAVQLQGDNPWWNARLVSFLIGQARFREARSEWIAAVGRVDPDGEWVRRDPWLARHLHRWVVTAWLDHAQVELAREAFDAIPQEQTSRDPALAALRQRLMDAEEARELGDSVYPATIPVDERWMRPRVLPERSASGARRRAWYPGRVVEGTTDGVVIVFAVPDEDPSKRRTKIRDVSADAWLRATDTLPQEAHGFVEVGTYEDGGMLIRWIDAPEAPWLRSVDPVEEVRYMARWATDATKERFPV